MSTPVPIKGHITNRNSSIVSKFEQKNTQPEYRNFQLHRVLTFKGPITPKEVCFCHLLKCFIRFLINSVDLDPVGAV